MAVDIFPDLVRAALQAQGYLTFENATYGLQSDSADYDALTAAPAQLRGIDLIALHPRKNGHDRILAVNCRGSAALNVERLIEGSEDDVAGAGFPELVEPHWAKAFRKCIREVIGGRVAFTHVTVARAIEGDRGLWTGHDGFRHMLGNPLLLWDFQDIVRFVGRTERANANDAALELVALFQRAA